jgi:hypothetical protein
VTPTSRPRTGFKRLDRNHCVFWDDEVGESIVEVTADESDGNQRRLMLVRPEDAARWPEIETAP